MYKTQGKSIIVLLMAFAVRAIALPEDAKAVLSVQAGSAELSQQSHLGVYKGGVALDQGSTHIRAASASTQGNAANQLVKAIIQGDAHTQAHYWSLLSLDKPMLHAYADTLIYYPIQQEVELIGHARVEQGKHTFTAAVIQYNLKTQHVSTKPMPGEQTTITIYPEQKS